MDVIIMALYRLWQVLKCIASIIFWPIMYILILIHELIHLFTALIVRIHVDSFSIGTYDQSRVINIGYKLEGIVEIYVPDIDEIEDAPTSYLIRLLIITLTAPVLSLVLNVYLTWRYPYLFSIPLFLMLDGLISDFEVARMITTELRNRYKNRSKLVLDK